jgi:hypothetical protein
VANPSSISGQGIPSRLALWRATMVSPEAHPNASK